MITPTHLTGFMTIHAGLRTEFGRLAQACRRPRDTEHEELIEEQLALMLEMLHSHHGHEDEVLWPKLAGHEPEARAALAALEAEHRLLDPLVRAASDVSTPLPERAQALHRLHELLNDHLDHEERVAVPLMLRHLTQEDIEADRRKAMEDFGRRRVPTIFGWLASCSDDELFAASYAELPAVARLLFRLFWWPAYHRRFAKLYGAGVPLGNSVLTG